MKNLILNLKKQYFEEIKKGIKKWEYRLCTPYWDKRLINKNYDKLIIKLGYPKDSEKEKILIFNYIGYEIQEILHEHFGKEVVKVYAIKLHEDIKTCLNCGSILTREEIEYYDNVCDSCESKIHEQLINELTKDNK